MKCFSPFLKYEASVGSVVPFPCGHCPTCRAQQAMTWSLRMFLESLRYKHNAFVTLTYDDAFLPDNNSLAPADLTSFLKRLRYRLNYKIRYYACGEYGDKFGRPHYHLIIFNLKQEDFYKVYEAWNMGIVEVEVPGVNAFKYVAGYVTKKIGKVSDWKLNNPGKVPSFQRASLGLGLWFINSVKHYTPILYVGDKPRYIGRYLRNKLADRLGILEQVKAQGLANLAVKFQELVTDYTFSKDYAILKESISFNETHDRYAFERSAWQWKHQGYFDDYLAKMRERQIKYRRGEYHEPTINNRVHRMRFGTRRSRMCS